MGPAKSEEDVVISLVPRRMLKRTEELKTQKMQESHRLDELIERAVRISVGELCKETGYSLGRVLDHVNYLISKGWAKLDASYIKRMDTPGDVTTPNS
jgi:hypothetical protein